MNKRQLKKAKSLSKPWKRYPRQMKAIALRRAALLEAIEKAGGWKPSRQLEVAMRGCDWIEVKTGDTVHYALTVKGLAQVAKAFGIKVPR